MDEPVAASESVSEFIKKEVPDWDDPVKLTARFKAFSGQRSDWEPQFLFWRDLIIKITRQFGFFRLPSSQIMEQWFNVGDLKPLCIDQVLLEMYKAGDIVSETNLRHSTSGSLSQLFRKVMQFTVGFRSPSPEDIFNDHLILFVVLKDKAADVVKALSESHWMSSCIITRKNLEDLCTTKHEASAILSYLSGCGKALPLRISKEEVTEGVKVSLTSAAVSSVTSLDRDILLLIWTKEKLQQQLDAMEERCEMSKKSAISASRSGNKKVALRHAREHKLAFNHVEKLMSLLSRVEEVLDSVVDVESTNKLSEALRVGAQAMKENKVNIEELELCLQDIEESIYSQEQVNSALESMPVLEVEDYDLEEELEKLELEIKDEDGLVSTPGTGEDKADREKKALEMAESLSNSLSRLKLAEPA